MAITNEAYLGALKETSQALARISELDKVITTEGELAVEYQKNVWARWVKRLFILLGLGGAVLGGVFFGVFLNEELSMGGAITLGICAGMIGALYIALTIQMISFFKMNSGKSKKPEHTHHVALVKAQKETYSLIKKAWKPNLVVLTKYARKNYGNLGEYGQLCDSLIRADSWVKTLTLRAQTAKLMKQNAAGAMKAALVLAVAAVAITGVMVDMVGSASQGVGGTRYEVTTEDGTTYYETR